VKSDDAVSLLTWAADNNIGHRAFLQAGDVHLVHSALERAAPALLRNGSRLDDLLGRDAARLFLMAVLRIASAGSPVGDRRGSSTMKSKRSCCCTSGDRIARCWAPPPTMPR
jgi:hypothetical protein